jgi:hypothetical protein
VTSSHRHIETERGASKEQRAEKLGEKNEKIRSLSKRISLSLCLTHARALTKKQKRTDDRRAVVAHHAHDGFALLFFTFGL